MRENSQNKVFLAPNLKPVFSRFLQSLSYLVAWIVEGIKLEVSGEDLDKIKKLGNARIIYLPNHPTLDDGLTLFMFSALNGQLFHYLVARDSFKGFLADFLPLVGCYSMRRGIGDRTSIVETIKLIQQPEIRLVIFPEGGCSYQNDTVIPFRHGAVSMAFQGLNKLAKKEENLPPIYLVPLSLKYYYLNPMNYSIENTLCHLEKTLKIVVNNDDNYYQRLRNIDRKVIDQLAEKYQVKIDNNQDRYWNDGINLLKEKMLEQCENKLNISANHQLPMRERVYQIQATLKEFLVAQENQNQELENLKQFIEDTTFHLLNFNAIYDGYVEENPDQERFLDTLNRLERSVFKIDKPTVKGIRKAVIKVSEPINLVDYYQSYNENKTETIENLTNHIQNLVLNNLKY